jgi:hypothetical protein
MKRLIVLFLILGLFAVVTGCDKGEKEAEVARTDDTGGSEKPSFYPEANALKKLQGPLLDSLKVKKKRFNITRDQYWQTKGGVLANEFLEVWYPPGRMTVTHGMYMFEEVMPARDKYKAVFGEVPQEFLVMVISQEIEPYKEETGRDWWYYAEMRGDTLIYVPVYTLYKRGISSIAVPHEYYQWAIRKTTRHGAPRWLEEGLASYLSGEGDLLLDQAYEFRADVPAMDTPEKVEAALQGEKERGESRIAYYRSYRMVMKLIETYGEGKLVEAVKEIGRGNTLDEAFEKAVGKSYADILEIASDYDIELKKKK